MSGLPTEVYFNIIQCANGHADILSLSICCSTFRDETQRVLFADPTLTSLQKQKQFIDVINASPARLGPYVRSFHILDVEQHPQVDFSDTSIASALQAMSKLKHLGIYRYLPMYILKGCTFSLLSFIVDAVTLRPSDISFLVCEFLPSQKDMRHLSIIGTKHVVDEPVPSTVICPRLDRLCVGSVSLAKVFLRRDDRPILRFQWWNRGTMPPLTVAQLNGLECLMFGIIRQNADTSFTRHLISLTLLELEIKMETVDQIINQVHFLAYLPRLEVFILRLFLTQGSQTLHASDDETSNMLPYLPIIRSAFAQRVTLKYVDVQHGQSLGYQRWFPPDESGRMTSEAVSTWADVLSWRC